jgi:murein DD-endopeptidase MepM/ murein hydrolase activator NlpD
MLVIVLILPLVIFPEDINALNETLQDLIDNLNDLEQRLEENAFDKELTEERRKQIEKNIIKLGFDIKAVEENILKLQDDILKLNEDIKDKDKEVKQLINFLQLTSSQNVYLEYAFGATSLTEFIYRFSIVEQLSKYNETLINNMNDMIKDKDDKSKGLQIEKKKLEQKKRDLGVEQEKLGERMNFLDEDARSLKEDIEDARKTIDNYKRLGCGPNDILEICSRIPDDSDFLRPLNQGYITSPYGIRDNPLNPGKGDYVWHYAIDIGGNSTGTPIYSTAAGRVVLVRHAQTPSIPNSSCGGNYVIIQHKINDVYYASRYFHLNKILVVENQEVTSNTVIALVGGGENYDRCTTGPHLDFAIAKGIYSQDFFYFREPYTLDPTTVINFPSLGVWYNNRYEKH